MAGLPCAVVSISAPLVDFWSKKSAISCVMLASCVMAIDWVLLGDWGEHAGWVGFLSIGGVCSACWVPSEEMRESKDRLGCETRGTVELGLLKVVGGARW